MKKGGEGRETVAFTPATLFPLPTARRVAAVTTGNKVHVVAMGRGQPYPEALKVLAPRLVVVEIPNDLTDMRLHTMVARVLLSTAGSAVVVAGMKVSVGQVVEGLQNELSNVSLQVRQLTTYCPGYGDDKLFCEEGLAVITKQRLPMKVQTPPLQAHWEGGGTKKGGKEG